MTINSALQGGTFKGISRYGDIQNRISIGTAGVFLAKDRFKENNPFSKEYDIDGNLTIRMNLHFMVEARRQLAGTPAEGTSTFSPQELLFWDDYGEWSTGTSKPASLVIALDAFSRWIVDELVGITQGTLDRTYTTDHKWRKTEEYIHDKGILWI